MASAVQPERILKDLAKLWVDLGKKEDEIERSAGVLRACAMTLIVADDYAADPQCVGETLADLMHQHPSRAIVLRVGAEVEPDLAARVFAQCWMPFGRRQQICCEEIEITSSPQRVADLPKLMLGLVAPDLPIVLWCRSQRLCESAEFRPLVAMAHKTIIDSAAFAEPAAGIAWLRERTAEGENVADLAWTRLTRWRESVAQIFQNQGALSHLRSIKKLSLGYRGRRIDEGRLEEVPALYYFSRWFTNTLPVQPQVAFEQTSGGEQRLMSVAIEAPGFRASVERSADLAITRVNEIERRSAFPKHSLCDLMQEELAILGTDTAFQRALGPKEQP